MKERIFYYDALKAFSIFVVIMGHVLLFSFHECNNMIWRFINVVNMAMFMFVSGLLSANPSKLNFGKKFRNLIIPTLVVGLIYTFIKGKNIPEFFTNSAHFGYWFCLTLFLYHIVSWLIFKIFDLLNIKREITKCILLTGGVFIILIISMLIPLNTTISGSLSLQQFFNFLPYYAYGVLLNIVPKFKERVENNNYIYSISLILVFVVSYLSLSNSLAKIVISFSYINVMVYIFYKICMNRRNRAVEYVAKRTLEIYLFHFFLLPAFIVKLPSIFNPDSNIIYTMIPLILISLTVLVATLVLTKLIEYSKLLSFLMLGKRPNNT